MKFKDTKIAKMKMSLKYQNQLKISLNKVQIINLKKLSILYGMSYQDVIRKAFDKFARVEINQKAWNLKTGVRYFITLKKLKNQDEFYNYITNYNKV